VSNIVLFIIHPLLEIFLTIQGHFVGHAITGGLSGGGGSAQPVPVAPPPPVAAAPNAEMISGICAYEMRTFLDYKNGTLPDNTFLLAISTNSNMARRIRRRYNHQHHRLIVAQVI
jgi:hypothetical protein